MNSRILIFIVTSLNKGGAEELVLRKIEFFLKKGFKVVLISLKNVKVEITIPLANKISIIRHDTSYNPLSIIKTLVKLRRKLNDYPENSIIFSHMIHANLFALILKRIGLKQKLICVAHNTREGNKVLEFIYASLSSKANHFIQVSKEGKEIFIKKGFNESNISVIQNGISTKKLRYSFNSPGSKNKLKILWVGRLVPQKNPLLALKILKDLKNMGYCFEAHIYGIGPLEKEMEEFISKNLLDEFVKLKGFEENKQEIYGGKNLFLMTSRFEGFALALGEAMFSGLIPVVLKCKGISDLLSETQCKPVLEGNLVSKIIEVNNTDSFILESISKTNSQIIDRKFSIHKMLECYHEFVG